MRFLKFLKSQWQQFRSVRYNQRVGFPKSKGPRFIPAVGGLQRKKVLDSHYHIIQTTVYNVRRGDGKYSKLLGHICDHDGNRFEVYKDDDLWIPRPTIYLGVVSSTKNDDKEGLPFVQWPS